MPEISPAPRMKRAPITDNGLAYPALRAPFVLAGVPLRNRLIHASISTFLAAESRVTDRLIHYYANRAQGGAALIITEPLSMIQRQDVPNWVRAWTNDNVDGLARWADAVEVHDTRLLGQLVDRGRGRNTPGRNPDAIGSSALPDDLSFTMPRALLSNEIEALIDEFSRSAARLQRCGFSGVEISAGHGHLFHQFLSPRMNVRTDRYGGDRAGRTRLLIELIAVIRAQCGAQFIVAVKLPGDDGLADSIDVVEAGAIAKLITAGGGVDLVSFAQGSHSDALERHVPDDYTPRLPYLPQLRILRGAIPGVPIAALGRITDPAEAEGILTRGEAELIAVGRALITDPAWLYKATHDRAHDIRYCVSCNTCWERTTALRLPIACDNNPMLAQANENDWWPRPETRRRRIVVVGAGPAGMEAAWTAAARGHDVTVLSRSVEVGGGARLRSMLPGGESISSVYDYQQGAAKKAGVKFVFGVNATVDDVLAFAPDVVVLASGATMVPPRWLPQDMRDEGLVPDLRAAMAGLSGIQGRQRGAAVVYDMDHTEGTYAAVERLQALFDRVVIVTARDAIARDTPVVTRQGILRRLHQKRVDIITSGEPIWNDGPEQGRIDIVNVYNDDIQSIKNLALLTYSTPRAPNIELLASLQNAGIEVHVIGDCRNARSMLAATAEGHATGNAV
jgi:2,4-dienoyl-CoA reductase-like NADH-dependent reductase (Old Yellow Enzyme family)